MRRHRYACRKYLLLSINVCIWYKTSEDIIVSSWIDNGMVQKKIGYDW